MKNIENPTEDEILQSQIMPEEETPLSDEKIVARIEETNDPTKTHSTEEAKASVFEDEPKKKATALWIKPELKEKFHTKRKAAKKKTNAYLEHLLSLDEQPTE